MIIFIMLLAPSLWAEDFPAPVEMGHGNWGKIQDKLHKLEAFVYKRFGRTVLDDDHHVPVTPAILLEKLDDLKKQMALLVGQMEEVQHSNAQLKAEIVVEGQKSAQAMHALEQKVHKLEQFQTTAEEKAFDDRIQNMTEDELYAIGERMKKEGKPSLAERALKLYIQRYPTTPRLQEAYRHLVDITYAQERYTDAALFAAQAYKINPNHPEMPEVLLKMGHALNKLGKKAEARTTFDKIKSDYPNLSSEMNLRLAQAVHDLEKENGVGEPTALANPVSPLPASEPVAAPIMEPLDLRNP